MNEQFVKAVYNTHFKDKGDFEGFKKQLQKPKFVKAVYNTHFKDKGDFEGFINTLKGGDVKPQNKSGFSGTNRSTMEALRNRGRKQQKPEEPSPEKEVGSSIFSGDYWSQAWEHTKSVMSEGWNRGNMGAEFDTWTGDMTNTPRKEVERQAALIGKSMENRENLDKEVGGDNGLLVEAFEWVGTQFSEVSKSLLSNVVESFNNKREMGELAGSFATGAAAGAGTAFGATAIANAVPGVGQVVSGVSTASGAVVGGFSTALAASAADVGAAIEFSSKLQEYGRKNNLDPSNPDDLEKIYRKGDFIRKFQKEANLKGGIEGTFEGVSNIIAPGVAKAATPLVSKGTGSVLSKLATRRLVESNVEGLAGGTGAVLGTMASDDDYTAGQLWDEFSTEYIVEATVGGTTLAGQRAMNRVVNRNQNRVKDQIIKSAVDKDKAGFIEGLELAKEKGIIKDTDLDYLTEKYDEAAEALSNVPEDVVKNKTNRRELVTLMLKKGSIDNQISKLKNKKTKSPSESIKDSIDKKIEKLEKRKEKVQSEIEFTSSKAIKFSEDNEASGNNSLPNSEVSEKDGGVDEDASDLLGFDKADDARSEFKNDIEPEYESGDYKKVLDLAEQAANGKVEFTDEQLQLVNNYPKLYEKLLGEIKEENESGVNVSKRKEKTKVYELVRSIVDEGRKDFSKEERALLDKYKDEAKAYYKEIYENRNRNNNKKAESIKKNRQGETITQEEVDSLTEFDLETDRRKLNGQEVEYGNEVGVFYYNDGVPYVEYSDGNQILVESGANPEVTNAELGLNEVVKEESPVEGTAESTETKTISAGDNIREFGQDFEVVRPRYDSDGNITDVLVKNKKGKQRRLNSKKVLSQFPQKVEKGNNSSTKKEGTSSDENFKPLSPDDFGDGGMDEVAEVELDNQILEEEKAQLESELESDAESLYDIVTGGKTDEFGDTETSFTQPFREFPVADKPTPQDKVSMMREAVSSGKAAKTKEVNESVGSETIDNIREKLKRLDEINEELAPENVAKKRKKAKEAKRNRNLNRMAESKYPGVTEKRNFLQKLLDKAKKALPSTNFVMYKTPDQFARKLADLRGKNEQSSDFMTVRGFYDANTDTVYINPYYATQSTVAHESAHAVINKMFKNKDADVKLIHQSIKEVLENSSNKTERDIAKQLDEFLEDYDSYETSEEFFAELVGLLNENKHKIRKPRRKTILEKVSKIIKDFTGLELFDNKSDINDLIDFVNDVSQGIEKGKDIESLVGFDPKLRDKRGVIKFQDGREMNPIQTIADSLLDKINPNTKYDPNTGNYVTDKNIQFKENVDPNNGKFTNSIRIDNLTFDENFSIDDIKDFIEVIDGLGLDTEVFVISRKEGVSTSEIVSELKTLGFESVTEGLPQNMKRKSKGELKYQKPKKTKKNPRKIILDNMVDNLKEFKSKYENAEKLYEEFKTRFDQNGVTYEDIYKVFRGENPHKSLKDYIINAAQVRQNIQSSLEKAGFDQEQIDSTVEIFQETAKAWAKSTGRQVDEFYTDILEDFRFASESSDLFSKDDSLSNKANKVTQEARKRAAKNAKRSERKKFKNGESTPLQEDTELEKSKSGRSFKNKNGEIIKGARKLTENGKAIIYVTTDADINTPVHELAHVYEMYMSDSDRKTVLNWTGHSSWKTATSEQFAKGFEDFLSESKTIKDRKLNNVFKKFSKWLKDIYGRVSASENGLNNSMRSVYAKMFSKNVGTLSENVSNDSKRARNDAARNYQKTGKVKADKKSVKKVVTELFTDPDVLFSSTTIGELVQRVLDRGLDRREKAMENVHKAIDNIKEDRSKGGSGAPRLTNEEYIGIAKYVFDAEAQIETQTELLEEAIRNGASQESIRKTQSNIRDLQNDVNIAKDVLNTGSSYMGQSLGMLSHTLKIDKYSVEAAQKRLEIIAEEKGKKNSKAFEDKIHKLYEELNEINEKIRKKAVEKSSNKKEKANTVFSKYSDMPIINGFRKVFNKFKKSEIKTVYDQNIKNIKSILEDTLFDSNKNLNFAYEINKAIILRQMEGKSFKNIDEIVSDLQSSVDSRITEAMVSEALLDINKDINPTISKIKDKKSDLNREFELFREVEELIKGLKKEGDVDAKSLNKFRELKAELMQILDRNINDEVVAADLMSRLDELHQIYNNLSIGSKEANVESITDEDINNLFSLLDGIEGVRYNDDDILFDSKSKKGKSRAEINEMKKAYIKKAIGKLNDDIADLNAVFKFKGEDAEAKMIKKFLELGKKYNINQKKVPTPFDKELTRLKVRLNQKNRELHEIVQKHTQSRWRRVLGEIWNIPKLMQLAADFSPVFYQAGLLTIRHPIRSSKILLETIKNGVSQKRYERTNHEMQEKYGAKFWEGLHYGLRVDTEEFGSVAEELKIKTILEKIPLIKHYATAVRTFSERSYNTYMNNMRLEEYAKMSEGITDPQVLEEIAETVNTFTGAATKFGNAKMSARINNMIKGSEPVFIAPRLYASTFKSFGRLVNPVRWYNLMDQIAQEKKKIKEGKDANLDRIKSNKREMRKSASIVGSQLAFLGVMYMLNDAFNEDEEESFQFINPLNSQFLKLKYGQTVITTTPFSSYLRTASKMSLKGLELAFDANIGSENISASNKINSIFKANRTWKEQMPKDIFIDEFLTYRLNPAITSLSKIVFNKDYRGENIPKDASTQITERYLSSFLPIPVQGLVKNIKEERYVAAPNELITDMFGLNTYTQSKFYSTGAQNEISRTGFHYRTSYPDWMKDSDVTRKDYKERVQEKLGKKLLEYRKKGIKIPKSGIKTWKDAYEKSVNAEMLKERNT